MSGGQGEPNTRLGKCEALEPFTIGTNHPKASLLQPSITFTAPNSDCQVEKRQARFPASSQGIWKHFKSYLPKRTLQNKESIAACNK